MEFFSSCYSAHLKTIFCLFSQHFCMYLDESLKKKRRGETWQSRAGLHILVLPGTHLLQKIANYLLHREPRIYIFWIFHVNGIIIYYLLCLFSVISYNVLKYMFYHLTVLHSFPWLNNVSIFIWESYLSYILVHLHLHLFSIPYSINFIPFST